MRNQGQILIGAVLVFLGLIYIISAVFKIDIGAICWPSALILAGIWLLWRPKFSLAGSPIQIDPLCNIRRTGNWPVEPAEIWMFVGDVRLDFTQTEIPIGETAFRIYGFVGDITLVLPEDAHVSVSASAFLNDAKIFGKKQNAFLTTLQYTSPADSSHERSIRSETFFFVCDLDLIYA
mgnify:CR=1 FL=1